MNEDELALQQLKWAVQALAASAEDQLRLFPHFACVVCELLTDFDHWHRATVWRESLEITDEQRQALQAVQMIYIDGMDDTPCFSTQAIRERADWEVLRAFAADCLSSFGWKKEIPPGGGSIYIKGG